MTKAPTKLLEFQQEVRKFNRNEMNWQTYIKINYEGLIRVLEQAADAAEYPKPLIIIVHQFNTIGGKLTFWTERIVEVARSYNGCVDFALADLETVSMGCKWNRYHMNAANSLPWVFAVDGLKRQYQMQGILSVANLTRFAEKVLKNELYKTELLPAQSEEARLKVAVGANFHELIEESKQDILLLFYTPACEDLRQILQMLQELAKLLANEQTLLLVKMNAAANYMPPSFHRAHYPSCIFIRSVNKSQYIEFKHKIYSVDNLMEFVALHASKELQNYNREGFPRSQYSSNINWQLQFAQFSEFSKFSEFSHLYDAFDVTLEKQENATKAEIMHYIDNSVFKGMLGVLSPNDGDKIQMFEKPLILILHNFCRKYDSILKHWSEFLLPVLREFQHQVQFLVCEWTEEVSMHIKRPGYTRHIDDQLFLSATYTPIFRGVDIEKRLHSLEDYYDQHLFREFVRKTAHNELFKSEALPIIRDYNKGLLTKAVGSNFEELVLHRQKDVFLSIYYDEIDPNDEKVFLSVAEELRHENIEIIYISRNLNYIPWDFEHSCYFIAKPAEAKPLMYGSSFTFSTIIKFLAKNATEEFRNYGRNGKRKEGAQNPI